MTENNEKDIIEMQLDEIEKYVFNSSKHKLDTYSLAMIRAMLLANQKVVKSNEEIVLGNEKLVLEIKNKIKGSIKSEQNYYYDALSAFWGQAGRLAFPCLAVIAISVLFYWYKTEERKTQELYQDAERIIILSEKLRDEKPKIYKEYMLEQAVTNYNNSKEGKK